MVSNVYHISLLSMTQIEIPEKLPLDAQTLFSLIPEPVQFRSQYCLEET